MIERRVKPWHKRLFLKKISVAVILIAAILLAVIIGVSLYGSKVGNFVVSIDSDTTYSMTLSEDGDFASNQTSRLFAEGLNNATHATFANIPEDINKYNGANVDNENRRYAAYSFYLKNTSPVAIDYRMKLTIDRVTLNVDSALRIMIYTDDEYVIYAKPKQDGTPESHPGIERPYETQPFLSASTVCEVVTQNFEKDSVVKYTVVLWLEGYDEECVDDIKGGAIQLSMDFTAAFS